MKEDKRVAVLDLGTNTFNLVIAFQKGPDSFDIIHSSKLPVKLGEGGINNGEIKPAAFQRGIDAINHHYSTIKLFEAGKIFAFGTSALRTARNGEKFISMVKSNTGINVEIISGELEAELIYYGVRQTLQMTDEKCLILDIGGGSNELVIADKDTIFWKKSYKLGIARLLEQFSPSDPLQPYEIESIISFLDREMEDLVFEAKKYSVGTLLGASGSFETFVSMICCNEIHSETESATQPKSTRIRLDEFEDLYQKLIRSTREERSKMKGLEPMRIEMIVLAALFVKFIIGKLGIRSIIQSNFSLKEGVIYKLINS
jgi:exopolyphosphatase/guanosine-5'-triphosphate,3'-diphosphate pyrophosphatase